MNSDNQNNNMNTVTNNSAGTSTDTNATNVDTSAQNINNLLDNKDVKPHIGENVKAYNTPVLSEIKEVNTGPTIVVQKVKNKATPLFLIIILLLLGAAYYSYDQATKTKYYYEKEYSPVTGKDVKVLANESFLVQNLYNTIKTNVEEDTVNPNLDNNMKLYLAYRNVSNNYIYTSNCNMFNNGAMQSFTCDPADKDFTPTAFKIEVLQRSINKIFGETSGVELANIQLGNSCLGGYQYIPDRGEFVSGKCSAEIPIICTASKEIVKATSTEDTVTIEEKVKYTNPTGGEIPSTLKSGTYLHKFKLDKNYDYIYVSKELKERG